MQQVKSAYAWQRETNDLFTKRGISQNIAERLLNISSILSNFKSLIKQVYQKGFTQKFNKKKDQNNYLRAGIR